MSHLLPLIDLTRPYAITTPAARHYLNLLSAIVASKLAGRDVREPVGLSDTNGITPQAVQFESGTPVQDDYAWTQREGVAIVGFRGPVVRYGGMLSAISGVASVGLLAQSMKQALSWPSVKGIIVNFDSPGGDTTSLAETAYWIYQARAQGIPIIAYVDGSCCSAAYWLASACHEIVISRNGIAGSIGCCLAVQDDTKAMEMEGIREFHFVSSQSPNKWLKVTTKAGQDQRQSLVDAMAQVMGEQIAKFRGVSIDTVWGKYGGGDVKIGQDAVNAGLVDRMGDFESLLAQLANGYTPKRMPRGSQQNSGVYGANLGVSMLGQNNQFVHGLLTGMGFIGQTNGVPGGGSENENGATPQIVYVQAPPAGTPPALPAAAYPGAAPAYPQVAPAPAFGTGQPLALVPAPGTAQPLATLPAQPAGWMPGQPAAPLAADNPLVAQLQQQVAALTAQLNGTNNMNLEAMVAAAQGKVDAFLHTDVQGLFASAQAGTLDVTALNAFFQRMPQHPMLTRPVPGVGAAPGAPAVVPTPAAGAPTAAPVETIPETPGVPPFNGNMGGQPITAERRALLLGQTELGRRALAGSNGGGR